MFYSFVCSSENVQIYITITVDRSNTNVLQALPKRKSAPSEKD